MHISGSRQMGGADQFFIRLLRGLHEAGHRVRAVTRDSSPIAKALHATPIAQTHLPLASSWDLYSLLRVRQLIKSSQPQIVQTYMGRATRLTRVPSTSSAVHIARLGGYYKLDGYYRHADAWIGNTKGICDYLVRSGLPSTRVFHIGNFAPEPEIHDSTQLQALRVDLRLPSDAFVIFALGRLIEKKGFDDLLHAFAQLPPTLAVRPPHLLLAGDGPMLEQLRRLSESLHLSDKVHWLGWQDQPGKYFSLADLVVCPSRHEPLGNVILEAWSYSKPVLSTATEGPTELIKDNVNGLLVPARDPLALAARLKSLLSSSDASLLQVGMEGKKTLDARFGKSTIVKCYLELYAHLASTSAGKMAA